MVGSPLALAVYRSSPVEMSDALTENSLPVDFDREVADPFAVAMSFPFGNELGEKRNT